MRILAAFILTSLLAFSLEASEEDVNPRKRPREEVVLWQFDDNLLLREDKFVFRQFRPIVEEQQHLLLLQANKGCRRAQEEIVSRMFWKSIPALERDLIRGYASIEMDAWKPYLMEKVTHDLEVAEFIVRICDEESLRCHFDGLYETIVSANEQRTPLGIYLHYMAVHRKERNEELFQQLARQGYPCAQFEVFQDFEASDMPKELIQSIHRLADQGMPLAKGLLAWCYMLGIGVEKNESEAARQYLCAASKGHAMSQYYLAMHFLDNLDYNNAFLWMNKAAHQGHVTAQYALATFYRKGIGVTAGADKAVYWLEKAAAHGKKKAMLELAEAYLPQNRDRAIQLLNELHYHDYVPAQSRLGQIYYKSSQWSDAFKYLTLAAGQDDFVADYYLGLSYLNGCGVTCDSKKGFEMIARVAENHGYAHAQVRLAQCYRRGLGVPVDIDSAVYWLLEAIEQGEPTARQEFRSLMGYRTLPYESSLDFITVVSNLKKNMQQLNEDLQEKSKAPSRPACFDAIKETLMPFCQELTDLLKQLKHTTPGFMVNCFQKPPMFKGVVENCKYIFCDNRQLVSVGADNVLAARRFYAYMEDVQEKFVVIESALAKGLEDLAPKLGILFAARALALKGNADMSSLAQKLKALHASQDQIASPFVEAINRYRVMLKAMLVAMENLMFDTLNSRNLAAGKAVSE